ncbi:hydroxypyruvate isomerase family protein [Opitutus terrae]|uniref:Xylose isomerase domain protein TIM barrel n=1 Tax=Opitutus terrae (strain DSM 11246 / JCM 15787 / PB90-1) TaxID=452637 RepID=B1ZQN7_OPITP|nr:TIM barrel protein [Opitutus terrae]ACB75646.1 Xylose isomerase domain protein TIM barrel [Opitutus terrae PB90-1]
MPPGLTRRQAVLSLASLAAASSLPALGRAATATTPETAPATSAGPGFRHSVCRWCYNKIPLEELARAAKEIGLHSVELLGPDEWPVVQRHGLTCAMANGTTTIPRGLNRLEHHADYVPSMIERIRAVAAAGLPNVIVFSGNRDGMPDEQGLENCAIALKQLVGEAEKQRVTICMELLNSKVNHKDYMCDHTAWGAELVRRVSSERFKLLYDIYHMQIMEGDVIRTIQENHAFIGHYHTGGNPGRNEIDETQELYYPAIMRAIKATGFTGFVAQEFIPKRDPLTSLRDAVQRCSV